MSDPGKTAAADGAAAASPAADTSKWKHRLRHLDRILSRRSNSPRVRNILLVVSLIAFVAIAFFSYRALPADTEIHWWLTIPLIIAGAPATMLANAAEYRVVAKVSGSSPGMLEALRLSLIATAANLLPIPGSIMIRTQALRADGISYKRALGANVIAGGAWIGVGGTATGVLLLTSTKTWIWGLLILLVGLAALTVVMFLMRRLRPERVVALFAELVAVEVVTVMLSAIRMWLAFAVLGMSINLTQAVALTTPAILAAAIGIFPAGLGLREGLAGLIGLAVGVKVGASVLATAVDRVCAQIGLALLTGGTLLIGGKKVFAANGPQSAEAVSGQEGGALPAERDA
jgi:hypothetical protein